MTPINESERKQAITKFWGLYAVIGFALLCMLLGGFILKNSTLREAERTEFETFKANQTFSQNMANRMKALTPKVLYVFDKQNKIHFDLYPEQEGANITLNDYRLDVNAVAKESTKMNDSLKNIFTLIEGKNKEGKLADPLSESNLDLLRQLLGRTDTAYNSIIVSAKKLRMSPLNAIGIATIHEGVGEGTSSDPVLEKSNEEIQKLNDQIEALKAKDVNKAVSDALDAKTTAENELAEVVKDAGIQKKLKEAYKNHGAASGMLEVTEKIVGMANRNGNKLFSNKKMQEEYEKVINDYKATIMSKLEAANEKIADMNNGEAIALRTIIGNLESRVRQLSVSN